MRYQPYILRVELATDFKIVSIKFVRLFNTLGHN